MYQLDMGIWSLRSNWCLWLSWTGTWVALLRAVIGINIIMFTHIWKKILVTLLKAGFRNNLPSPAWRVSMALIRAVIINNIIIYTVSALISSRAAFIIFFSAGTRRVFPVEIFLSRDVAPVSAMFIVSSTSSIYLSLFCWCCVCGLLLGWYWLTDGPKNGRFVRFADVATGNSWWYKWLCPCIGDLLCAGYHRFRFRLPVLHCFWYWVPCCWLFGTYFFWCIAGCGLWGWWCPWKGQFFHFLYGKYGTCVCQWNGGWLSVALFRWVCLFVCSK